jgi:4-hydroxymandelate oxidase
VKALKLQALPEGVTRAADYDAHARQALEPVAWDYLSAHAGDGVTARANRAAWDAIALLPRVLRTTSAPRMEGTLLGQAMPWPVLVAPMALQTLAHSDGETAVAMAAAAQGAGFVLSSQAGTPLETVAALARADSGRGPLWFQLYWMADRGALLDLVQRVESAGYEALVLTVDAAVRGQRPGLQLPPGTATVNLPPAAGAPRNLEALLAEAPTWDDVAWLRSRTRLPLLLKGVLHPGDALLAASQGVAALVVSNHGGRVLDTAAATALALPRIAEAVGGALPLLVDGGISRGTDVLKALALGAQAVLVGRPVLWGLAAAGAAGAAHVLRLLRDEFQLALAQCGVLDAGAVTPELLLNHALDLSQPCGK